MKKYKLLFVLLIICLLFIEYKKNYFLENYLKNFKLAIHTVFLPKENILFIEEWIKYHINLGVDHFYLYNNDGSVGRNGSDKNKNKYNIPFNKVINIDYKKEIEKINKKYPQVTFIKWMPRDCKNKITYNYPLSIKHYIKNYKKKNDWTVFIDMDEFIVLKDTNSNDIKSYIMDKDKQNINKIVILQKKFEDRFCCLDKSVFSINKTLENVNTNGWGEKNICKNENLNNNFRNCSMHHILMNNENKIKEKLNKLRFNHYNMNLKQLQWTKNNISKSYKIGKDTSMEKYIEFSDDIESRKYNKR